MTVGDLANEYGIPKHSACLIAREAIHAFDRVHKGEAYGLTKTQIATLRPLFLAERKPSRPPMLPATIGSLFSEESKPMNEIAPKIEVMPKGAELVALGLIEATKMLAERDAALAAAKPKIEGFDALMKSDRAMSITEAAKYFGLHSKLEVFPYLRAHGYLTRDDLPTQAALDADYLSLKKNPSADGRIFTQAVVLDCQLETWRLRVVPQIKKWIEDVA
jgi:phage antirepressor YoqD-like protein